MSGRKYKFYPENNKKWEWHNQQFRKISISSLENKLSKQE